MTARIGYARGVARKVLKQFGSTAPPVEVEAIATFHGYTIVREDREPAWSGSLSGHRIAVNARHPSTRQRFTIAHELGHALLAHQAGDLGFTDRPGTDVGEEVYVDPTDEQEVEANAFAAELLAPIAWVKKAYAKARSPTAMAPTFGLSIEAMWRACLGAGCIRGR